MGIRSLKTASISTGTKRSKVWDQSAVVSNTSFESIATQTVGAGGAASVTFSSIPSTYKHLQLRLIGKDNRGATADSMNFVINSDSTSSNYHMHRLIGYPGGALAQDGGNSNGIAVISGESSGSVFGASIVDFLDYSQTTRFKTARALSAVDNNTAGEIGLYSMVWMNTAAISSMTLTPTNGSAFNQYSQFALYGIKG